MIKDISIDFGHGIAYLIPGMLTALALNKFFPEIESLFKRVYEGNAIVGALALLVVLSIVLGLIISVLRGIVIDQTFSKRLPEWSKFGILHLHTSPIKNKEVSFAFLSNEGIMAAYRETRNLRRLYQFYGNTLLALILILLSRAPWFASITLTSPLSYGRFSLEASGVVIIAWVLYSACRTTFFSLSVANKEINEAAGGAS